jgi:hypothetical protein
MSSVGNGGLGRTLRNKSDASSGGSCSANRRISSRVGASCMGSTSRFCTEHWPDSQMRFPSEVIVMAVR